MTQEMISLDETELEAAEKEAAEVLEDVYVHTFSRPFEFEGNTYDKLYFDFGSLTGRDSLAIENELSALGKPVVVRELSAEYQIRVAARACDAPISADAFNAMSLRDCNKILSKARSFLLGVTL